MKKKQFGKLIYILAIALLIVFGFVLPAMRNSSVTDTDLSEKTLQVVEADSEEVSSIDISEDEAEAEVTENVSHEEDSSTAIINEADALDDETFISDEEELSNLDDNSLEAVDNKEIELTDEQADLGITEDGQYSSKEEVALYLHTYGHLPSNYLTKNEAKELGWGDKGTLNKVAPGMSIGGDKFGNREGLLPTAKGRKYYECDIDYKKGSRNAKRIIYSNDGLIFYTDDHYESFEQLY